MTAVTRATGRAPVFDVAIVGAGPAGLAAATHAAEAGAGVVVIDANEQPGGQFWRHRSETQSATNAPADDGALHHGWNDYLALRARFDEGVARGRITPFFFTSVWMARTPGSDAPRVALNLTASVSTIAPPAPPLVRAHALVIATGGYDRQLPVPGWQLPGVYAAGGIQAFAKQNGSLPGSRFVVAGTGPFLLPVADNIVSLGGTVAAVLESASLAGWVPRVHRAALVPAKAIEGIGYAATFVRHRIPYRQRTVITEILGDRHVEALRTARVTRSGDVMTGSERIIDNIDGVGLGWGFTPQLELPVSLGVATRIDVDGSLVATVDPAQHSSVPGVFLAGEITGVGGAVLSVLEGEIAGSSAAAYAAGGMPAPASGRVARNIARQRSFAEAMHRAHPVPAGWQSRLHDDTIVCRCEEVTAEQVHEARETVDARDARTQKGATRAGMGWCQGRVCGFAVSCLASTDGTPAQSSLLSVNKRPVAQPLTLAEISALPTD